MKQQSIVLGLLSQNWLKQLDYFYGVNTGHKTVNRTATNHTQTSAEAQIISRSSAELQQISMRSSADPQQIFSRSPVDL